MSSSLSNAAKCAGKNTANKVVTAVSPLEEILIEAKKRNDHNKYKHQMVASGETAIFINTASFEFIVVAGTAIVEVDGVPIEYPINDTVYGNKWSADDVNPDEVSIQVSEDSSVYVAWVE